MLLTLVKKRKTRYGWQVLWIETNHLTGDRLLGRGHMLFDDWPLELIYPLHITHSGIFIRQRHLKCKWKDRETKLVVEGFLRRIQNSREEIFIDIT